MPDEDKPVRKRSKKTTSSSKVLLKPKEEFIEEDFQRDCQCYYCGEMVTKRDIQDHMKSSHGRFHRKMYGEPRPLQCQVCKATFEKQSALTTHR